MAKKTAVKKALPRIPLLISGEERLRVWEEAKGMLKPKAPAMLKELRKIRKEWSRKLPPLK